MRFPMGMVLTCSLVLVALTQVRRESHFCPNGENNVKTVHFGHMTVVGERDGAIVFVSPKGKERNDVIHQSEITTLAVSPNKKWIISGDAQGYCALWHLKNRHFVRYLWMGVSNHSRVSESIFTSDSRWAVVSGRDGFGSSVIHTFPIPSGQSLNVGQLTLMQIGEYAGALDIASQKEFWVSDSSFSPTQEYKIKYHAQALKSLRQKH